MSGQHEWDHMQHLSPYMIPPLKGPVEKHSVQVDQTQTKNLQERLLEDKKKDDIKIFRSQLEEEQRKREQLKIMRERQANQKTEIALNDISTEQTQTIAKQFCQAIVKQQFASKLASDVEKSAINFVDIAFDEIKFEILKQNKLDNEKRAKTGDHRARPENFFIKSEFYQKIVRQTIQDILQGQRRICAGYNIKTIDTISEEALKKLKQASVFE
ncbi:Conserved_hypothetical protein [Hexamita inflata]|uniref:Uncharacterized protein n=1 Tax=Hexamita inflata TaxID=28002 RepID=A0ABP1GHM1_9EUKA